MKYLTLTVCILLLCLVSSVSSYNPGPDPPASELPAILLQARSIQPTRGIDLHSADALRRAANQAQDKGYHVLVQLDHIPTAAEKAKLAAQGVELQTYLPDQAWVAHVTAARSDTLETLVGRRELAWAGALLPTDKIEPGLAARRQETDAFAASQGRLVLNVEFHPDVSLAEGRRLLEKYGAVVLNEARLINTLVAGLTLDQIDNLAAQDAIMWLEQALPGLEPTNNNTSAVINVDNVRNTAPYNLNGSGIDVLVYDGGVASHNDYNARRIDTDGSGNSDHATHVAGTVLGDGSGDANAEGMAPSADLISYGYQVSFWQWLFDDVIFYDNVGDIEADWKHAKYHYGADLGTASLGSNVYANGYNCNLYGNYYTTDRLLDSIVRGKFREPYIMTWAAGNERGGRCDDGSGWRTTAPPANAKNPIQVCATNMAGTATAGFSSWGPTDDDRLKPIVCAPGSNVYSTFLGNSYGTMSGTSMATPAVAGTIALMLEQFRDSYNTSDEFLPATAKAILINTTTDMGNAGPDFQSGYGLVNAQAAVDTIRENRFREGTMENTGEKKQYRVLIPAGTATFQVSLAWDDSPGASLAAKELVNDLDLVLIEPNGATLHRPWILDPANPGNAAVTGIDERNNQEQVTVASPTAGWWTIEISTPVLASSEQTFGLASTHAPWTFELKAPTTLQPADAGYYLGPGKFIVRLFISDGFHPSTNIANLDPDTELQMFVGAEEIGVSSGDILHSGSVGNEYHLVVRAPGQSSDGSYDFSVNFNPSAFPTVAFGETETDAVHYQDTPNDPKAMSVVIDTSGSMSYDGKLDAAKNSARTYIFAREIRDAVAQVEFNSNTNIFQPLTNVNTEADLNTFSSNLDPLTAGGVTGLGQGALDGYQQVEPDSRLPFIVLLSDGLQNRDPRWRDVRDSIPRNVRIDTVSVGEDADEALLEEIAIRHGGDYNHVSTGLGALRAPSSDPSVATHLENRLADVYLFISDEVSDYERQAEWSNTLAGGGTTTIDFTLNESVDWIFFTVNWAGASNDLELSLYKPGGALAVPDSNTIYRSDVTSERYRMTAPALGTWQMKIKNNSSASTEYLAIVHGPTATDLMLFTPWIGTCRPDVPEYICGGFADDMGYVPGSQDMILYVNSSSASQGMDVGGGKYCFEVPANLIVQGPNSLKWDGYGQDRDGNPIHRIKRKSFYCGSRDVPPVLLVNDDQEIQGELYYPERDTYTSALDAISIAHDVWDSQIHGPPSASVLQDYDTVIWLTAEDDTNDPSTGMGLIDPDSQAAIAAFLKFKEGNIFALSSQGYLSFHGPATSFGQDVLGVDGFWTVSTTQMRGLRNSALGHGFGSAALSSSSADALTPGARTQANFVNDAGDTVGVTNFYGQGCSAFFSLPLEALAAADLQAILDLIVSWECAPVDIAVDTSATDTSPSLVFGAVLTETFSIENSDVGALAVGLNNGPTHLWMLTDSSGGVPGLLTPYDVGDLPSPARAPFASNPFDPALSVSRVCEMTTGLGDCCPGGVCTQETLLDNDIIIVWNDAPFGDPVELGDMLADFVDLGGTVLLGGYALPGSSFGIEGRFATQGYSPLKVIGAGSLGLAALQDVVFDPSDPLFANVVTPIETDDHHAVDVAGEPGVVTQHALWDSGELMAATLTVHAGTFGQVIAYNGLFEDGDWGGDLHQLLANALGLLDSSWRQPGWFSTVCSQSPNAGTGALPIVFDSASSCPLVQQGVNWQMGLQFDAGFADVGDLDATNQYHGKIAITHNDFGRDRINVPISLTIINVSLWPHQQYLPTIRR